jgi:hypothetical protein
MTAKRTINIPSGLPASVNSDDPKELRRIINRELEVLRTWNGEVGDPGDRLVRFSELEGLGGDGDTIINNTYITGGGGACERICVKDYGAVGDGTTNDTTAFRDALTAATGKLLYVPAGTYYLPYSESIGLTFPAGTILEGDGPGLSKLLPVPSGAGSKIHVKLVGDCQLRRLQILGNSASTNDQSCVRVSGNNVVIDECIIDAFTTWSGSAFNHLGDGVDFDSAGNISNLTIRSSLISRCRYGIYHGSSLGSVEARVRITHTDFTSNVIASVAFDQAYAASSALQIQGCRFTSPAAYSGGDSWHVKLSGVDEFAILGCFTAGTVTYAIQLINDVRGGVISGNLITVNGHGILLSGATSAGSDDTPGNIVVSSNRITYTGGGLSNDGIKVDDNADLISLSSFRPGNIVANNVIEKFYNGIYVIAGTNDSVKVTNNVAFSCYNGYFLNRGAMSIDGNVSQLCTMGAVCDLGGVLVRHNFVNCWENIDAINRQTLLMDPSFEWNEVNMVASSTLNLPMLPIASGGRCYGDAVTHVFGDTAADTVSRHDFISWNGTTLTRTNRYNISGGGTFTADTVNVSNVLNTRVVNVLARDNVRIVTHMRGSFVVAV